MVVNLFTIYNKLTPILALRDPDLGEGFAISFRDSKSPFNFIPTGLFSESNRQ